MGNKTRQQSGFTLVETLIALSIFALIALGGVGLLNITLTSQERLDAAAEGSRTLQRMQAILRADFGQMVERQSRSSDGGWSRQAGQDANGTVLEFARLGRLADPEAPTGQLEKVRYWISGGALLRSAYGHADGAEAGRAITLLPQVTGARVRVFRAGRWARLEAARMTGALPQGVELQLNHERLGEVTVRFVTPGPALVLPADQGGVS
jgi:general secretion pathway protein J